MPAGSGAVRSVGWGKVQAAARVICGPAWYSLAKHWRRNRCVAPWGLGVNGRGEMSEFGSVRVVVSVLAVGEVD